MATFQCGPHDIDVADAFEGIVHATVSQFNDHFLNRLVIVFGIDAVGCAKLSCQVELAVVDIDDDNPTRLGHGRTNNRRQADTAETENGHRSAFFHLGGIHDRAHAGGYAAAQQAHLFQRGFLVDLCQRNLRQNGVLGEGRATHVVIDWLSVLVEAAGAVGHQPLALGFADFPAQVGFAGQAEFALATFGGIQRNHMIADGNTGNAFTDRLYNAAPLMAKD